MGGENVPGQKRARLDRGMLRTMAEPNQTLLIVVHGAPGSGKSTLARSLGLELGLPVFDRDDFKDAMFDDLGWSDRAWSLKIGEASWTLMGVCIERLLSSDVSMIAESNLRPADPLSSRLRFLCADIDALAVEVYCTARADVLWERFDGRRRAGGRPPGHVGFEDRDTFLDDLERRPHGPLGLGGVLIEVDTTDEWPQPASVVDRVQSAVEVHHRRRADGRTTST